MCVRVCVAAAGVSWQLCEWRWQCPDAAFSVLWEPFCLSLISESGLPPHPTHPQPITSPLSLAENIETQSDLSLSLCLTHSISLPLLQCSSPTCFSFLGSSALCPPPHHLFSLLSPASSSSSSSSLNPHLSSVSAHSLSLPLCHTLLLLSRLSCCATRF